jgi:hypothetical protein
MLEAKMIQLGKLVMTSGMSHWAGHDAARMEGILHLVKKHQSGNWGEVDSEDWQANDQSVEEGTRILSSYTLFGEKIWVITEWDRSVTTVLFPSEY